MKYYIISGEASGDLHASNLARQLFLFDNQAQIRAWGGDLLRKAGVEVVKDYKDLAYMGFVEVVLHLGKILKNMAFCKKNILEYQPDAVILVDYPGFNLRLAKFLHKKQIKVFYYISPQVWAWKKSRVKTIKQYVDEMFVILPFEQDFYKKYDINAHYFGHPLLDVVKQYHISEDFKHKNNLDNRPIIAILPGSRKQEILRMLPTMLNVAQKFPDYQFVIAGVKNHQGLYTQSNINVVYNQTYNLLSHSYAALVTSGTATLETALFNVPQVVCYKGNFFSYLIAKHLISGIKYISLVNLIADEKVVTELIQNEMNANLLKRELEKILSNNEARTKMLESYKTLHHRLGDGSASKYIAEKMIQLLGNK